MSAAFDAADGDEGQAGVAHSLQHAMQCSLVRDPAVDDRHAVGFVVERQPVEPGTPSAVKVSLEPDFVAAGLAVVSVRSSAHLLLSAGAATSSSACFGS